MTNRRIKGWIAPAERAHALRSTSGVAVRLAVAALCLVLAACSSAASSASSPSSQIQPPTPDPCTLLTDSQVEQAYATWLRSANDNDGISTQDSYKPGVDANGEQANCSWTANTLTSQGLTLPAPLFLLEDGPANIFDSTVTCAKSVTGLGQRACFDASGYLDVIDAGFWISINDQTDQKTPDQTAEKELASDVVASLAS